MKMKEWNLISIINKLKLFSFTQNLQYDPLSQEDFNTEEDERGLEELRRIVEEKKKE